MALPLFSRSVSLPTLRLDLFTRAWILEWSLQVGVFVSIALAQGGVETTKRIEAESDK